MYVAMIHNYSTHDCSLITTKPHGNAYFPESLRPQACAGRITNQLTNQVPGEELTNRIKYFYTHAHAQRTVLAIKVGVAAHSAHFY